MEPSDVVQTKLLPLARQVAVDALRDVELLRFDKTNPQQLFAVCSYGTLLEIAYGCILLLENNQITASPILSRSLLEAYADFRANLEDPEYYKNLYAIFVNEKLRFLKNVQESQQNPFFTDIPKKMDVVSEMASLKDELNEFKKQDRGPLDVKTRFEKGQLKNEYQSAYWLLCLHGHNTLSALEERHIKSEGDDYNVVVFREVEQKNLVRDLDSLIAILIESSERVHKLLGTTTTLRIEQAKKLFDETRASYNN